MKIKMSKADFDELVRLDVEAKEAAERARKFREDWVARNGAVAVGHDVEVNTWGYLGKTMRVTDIQLKDEYHGLLGKNLVVKAVGDVVKKDGTPGLNCGVCEWVVEVEK